MMHKALAALSQGEKEKLEQRPLPEWRAPMLATLKKNTFSDENWIYERKLDGMRCLAYVGEDEAPRLMSRNRNCLNNQYPSLVEVLETLEGTMILDGEIVAFEDGVTSFAKLQNRMHIQDPEKARKSDVAVFFYLFDLLYFAGHVTTGLPQRTRKSLLKRILPFRDPLRFLPHRNGAGEAYYREACKKGWEGIIAKQAEAPYQHKRSTQWLKFKCVQQQEFVIGGFTDPKGERVGFGALLLGYYNKDQLRFAGKVGTGFDDELLRKLSDRMNSLAQEFSSFSAPGEIDQRGVHWVAPQLVAEIGFEEWTEADKLRHPRFLGLREDKAPHEVRRETPQ